MAELGSNRKIEKLSFVGYSGLFLLLVANFQFVATSVTWTAPPPARTPTGSDDIRIVNMSVVKGSTQVPLRWNYTLSSGSVILTTFSLRLNDGSFDDIGTTRAGIFNIKDYRARFDISGSEVATLIIKNVLEREEGVYQCKLNTDFNNWSDRIRVIVTVPASITNVSDDQTVREGSNIQLFCEATGKPTPNNITWTRVLEDGSNSEVLQHQGPIWDFPNINRTDAGTYRCTAHNGFGNPVVHKVKVDVTYPAEVFNMSASKHVEVKESVSLQCTADGNPQPTYTWRPCDPQQSVTCDKSKLDVSEVMYDDVYICTVANFLGNNSGNVSVFIAGKVINVTLVITSESCPNGNYDQSSLWIKLNKTFHEVFADESRYTSAQLKDVRCGSGSITTDLVLKFNSTVRETEVIDILKNAAQNGTLVEVKVDVSSIKGTRPIDEKPTQVATTTSSSPSNSNTWIIVGAVLGSLALLVVAGVVAWFVYRKRKCKKRDTKVHNNGSHGEEGGNVQGEGYAGRGSRHSGGGNPSSVPPVVYDTAQTGGRGAIRGPPVAEYAVVDKSKKKPKKPKPGELQYAELAEFSSGQGGQRSSTSPTNRHTETQYADVNAM